MYNEKRKQQYLNEKQQKIIKFSQNIVDTFEDIAQYEEKLNRDICEWNTKEILAYYRKLATPYVQTLIVIHSALSQYAEWCLDNGLIKDNQNHFKEIPTETVIGCADINALSERVFTREELLSELKELPNDSDKFIILGLFEGIPIRDGTMARIKMGDLVDNELPLYNKDGIRIATRTISKELHHIMENANVEERYTSMASQQRSYPYDMNETTVLKKIVSRKNALRCTDTSLAQRMRNSFRWLGHENITIKLLMESGRIHFVKELCKANGLTVEEAITNHSYRTLHEDIYGKIQSIPVYFQTYGRFYDEPIVD